VVVIAVVFNTIRLQVLTQREEIAVSKLLGATDNFIHRPFYYTGALLGLCAGAVALGAVSLALRPLNAAIAEFARLYASEFQLTPLPPLGWRPCWPSAPAWGWWARCCRCSGIWRGSTELSFLPRPVNPSAAGQSNPAADAGIRLHGNVRQPTEPRSTCRLTCLLPISNVTSVTFEPHQLDSSYLLYS
jgi:hypothetical protein